MKSLQHYWYDKKSANTWLIRCLKPLSCLVSRIARKRLTGLIKPSGKALPIIVVGNISVGGTGKTPVTVFLIDLLLSQGYKPGVVSRGYGGKAERYPFHVNQDSSGLLSGDEPLMIASRCGCPVVVDPDRAAAVNALLQHYDVDVIISDDGLQHFALARDIEIVVIDGNRGLGNGLCLPAGPLREPATRLSDVDFVVHNSVLADLPAGLALPQSYVFGLKPHYVVHCLSGRRLPLAAVVEWSNIAALAGIGNPARFFTMLEAHNIVLSQQLPFADHHPFVRDDITAIDASIVLMTEKDAVKCRSFYDDRCWYVPVDACFDDSFSKNMLTAIEHFAATRCP